MAIKVNKKAALERNYFCSTEREREREKVQLTTLNQTTTLVVYNTQSGEHAKPKPWRKLT